MKKLTESAAKKLIVDTIRAASQYVLEIPLNSPSDDDIDTVRAAAELAHELIGRYTNALEDDSDMVAVLNGMALDDDLMELFEVVDFTTEMLEMMTDAV